jgi:hypothetical protein
MHVKPHTVIERNDSASLLARMIFRMTMNMTEDSQGYNWRQTYLEQDHRSSLLRNSKSRGPFLFPHAGPADESTHEIICYVL